MPGTGSVVVLPTGGDKSLLPGARGEAGQEPV